MRELIADHSLAHTLEEWALIGGILLAGAGYLFGSWRRSRDDSVNSALDVAASELDVLKVARERMAIELDEARARIGELEAIVEQLRREASALRELVILESLPPALTAALDERATTAVEGAERLHEETRARILRELTETERRLAELFRERGTRNE